MKCLVIQQKMIGDVLTSTLLCEVLREKYPDAEIHYLVNSNTLPVLAHHTSFDKLNSIDMKKKFMGLTC